MSDAPTLLRTEDHPYEAERLAAAFWRYLLLVGFDVPGRSSDVLFNEGDDYIHRYGGCDPLLFECETLGAKTGGPAFEKLTIGPRMPALQWGMIRLTVLVDRGTRVSLHGERLLALWDEFLEWLPSQRYQAGEQ